MNSAASELAVLNALFERVSPGGMIVFDDYGWSGYIQQKIAEDKFMTQRGYTILELPTGQGLVVKQLHY
jgi:predicted O-methyltransferase YrrM